MDSRVRVARQPIVYSDGSIYAYELLFRDFYQRPAEGAELFIANDRFATARVIVNALNQFGIRNLVGDYIAFLNTDADFILDDGILTIPANKFFIEVLEHVKVDAKLIERIKFLRSKGYKFALDDSNFTDEFLTNFHDLLEHIDILKVDITTTTPQEFKEGLKRLGDYKFKLLAEKVETQEEFENYKMMGCELFQGYFFARPEIKEQATLDPQQQGILRLITLLDEDIAQIKLVKEFEVAPQVSLQLLRYLNSAELELSVPISSIQHALTLLGKEPLKSWLLLISFSASFSNPTTSPLFELARSRSILMSAYAGIHQKDKIFIAQASFVGLLSLVDNIFKVPLTVIMDELNLDTTIRSAVTDHVGPLGSLLRLVLMTETMHPINYSKALEGLNITPTEVEDVLTKSYIKLSQLQLDH